MASICLYDIDFYHSSGFSPPNLELMKIFNYYNKKGDLIKFGKPKENFDRYNQIIFFKSNPKTKIPKTLSLTGENKQIYGYGFFKKFSPLANKFASLTPDYTPYNLNKSKIKNIKLYNQIENGSLIRVENEDFSDFNQDKPNIYIYDYDFMSLKNAEEFLLKYKRKYKINFLYPLIANNEDTFKKFFSVANDSNRRIIVNFIFSKEFFQKYYYENILFNSELLDSEKDYSIHLQRILKMILWAKKDQKPINFTFNNYSSLELKKHPILKLWQHIYHWNLMKTTETCYNYILKTIGNAQLENLTNSDKNLRLLLKQNPLSFNTKDIDFFENI